MLTPTELCQIVTKSHRRCSVHGPEGQSIGIKTKDDSYAAQNISPQSFSDWAFDCHILWIDFLVLYPKSDRQTDERWHLPLKDTSGDIILLFLFLIFSYCQQISWKDQKQQWTDLLTSTATTALVDRFLHHHIHSTVVWLDLILHTLICISPPIKIVPNKCTFYSCLNNVYY